MKISHALSVCAALFLIGAAPGFAQDAVAPGRGPVVAGVPAAAGRGPSGPGLALTTMAFPDGGEIPVKYTMASANAVSPDLQWTNVPASTVSFALIFHDADTSVQKKTDDIVHWAMFNIPGSARGLAEGVAAGAALPDGSVQAKNVRGANAYMGPGAPAGPFHHYTFELFALDIKLDLGADATRADIMKAMDGHILGKAVLIGRFHR